MAAIGATIAALTSGLLMAGAPTASASGYCGSSYNLIDTYRATYETKGGTTRGYVYLYYSPRGYNCAIVKPISSWSGDVDHMYIGISADNGNADYDYGVAYHYYAGPIYVYAPHSCITILGYFYGPDGRTYGANPRHTHCG